MSAYTDCGDPLFKTEDYYKKALIHSWYIQKCKKKQKNKTYSSTWKNITKASFAASMDQYCFEKV